MGQWLSEVDRVENYARAWDISVEHARVYFREPELRKFFEEAVRCAAIIKRG